MSPAREPLDPAELMAFVDGRLAHERARAFEERLRLAEEVRHYAAQRTALHARFDPVLDEHIPVRMLPRPRSPRHVVARLAIAAALLLLAPPGAASRRAPTWLAGPRDQTSPRSSAKRDAVAGLLERHASSRVLISPPTMRRPRPPRSPVG